ncbi:hypothetical protein [Deinococcus sonorensis]|uniref:DZANK-type domain-containing protein n=2 Tax=Deinococcus sonorensis TaxID=309891 RepID=A0AAU7U4R5_9DEIO
MPRLIRRVSPPEDSGRGPYYRLCPRCFRAVPGSTAERYCINDGTRLLDRCPCCGTRITSPYSRYCSGCGHPYAQA